MGPLPLALSPAVRAGRERGLRVRGSSPSERTYFFPTSAFTFSITANASAT